MGGAVRGARAGGEGGEAGGGGGGGGRGGLFRGCRGRPPRRRTESPGGALSVGARGRLTPGRQVEAVGYGMPGVRWAGAHRVRQARQSEDWQREMAALRAHWAPSAAAAGSGPAATTAAGSPERDAAGSGASAATGAGSSVEFEWELHQEALRAWEDAKQQARTDRERAFQAATRRWEAQQAGSRAAREGASRDGV